MTSAKVTDDDRFSLNPKQAIKILNEAVTEAESQGLEWNTDPIRLTPKPSLVAMVRKSRELELAAAAENGEDG